MSSDQSTSPDSQPSLIGGHVKYVQGAISSALGYESGETTKSQAVDEMKAANTSSSNEPDPPTQSGVLGTVEQKLGQVTGCEGMEKEGEARKPSGSEAASGTG